jgi:hypothetical protein
MDERFRHRLALHGILNVIAALLLGVAYGIVVVKSLAASDPAPFAEPLRAWKMAHLEALLNGLLLLALIPALCYLRGKRAQQCATGGAVLAAWCNTIASTLGALTGSRGAVANGLTWNSLVYALFVIGVVAITLSAITFAANLLRRQLPRDE